jgi:hypothetical protein
MKRLQENPDNAFYKGCFPVFSRERAAMTLPELPTEAPPPPPAPAPKKTSEPSPEVLAAEHEREARHVEVLRQLRILEDRTVNLRRKAHLTDENLLTQEKKLQTEIRSLTDELTDVRRSLAQLSAGLAEVQGELAHAATIYDVKAIEKYLAFWEPVGFVTQAELTRRHNLLKQRSGDEEQVVRTRTRELNG